MDKKDFWNYIKNNYIGYITYKHMRNPDNYFIGISNDPDGFLENYPHSSGVYLNIPRDEKAQKLFKDTYNVHHITRPIYGAIIFDMGVLKLIETEGYDIDDLYPYSLINRIKRLILHECRHQQQHDYLMEILQEDFDLVQSIYTNEEQKEFDGFEVDAERYAISYTTNEKDMRYTLDEFVVYLIDKYPDIFNEYSITYKLKEKKGVTNNE